MAESEQLSSEEKEQLLLWVEVQGFERHKSGGWFITPDMRQFCEENLDIIGKCMVFLEEQKMMTTFGFLLKVCPSLPEPYKTLYENST
jgi:hypothetical protein